MRIGIEIPKEFESDYNGDMFKDFFSRVLYDIKEGRCLCGSYEIETAEMFLKAFDESKNDICEWKYDGTIYDRCPHKETLFARIHNCDEKIFKFCPYCGKKIKVVE